MMYHSNSVQAGWKYPNIKHVYNIDELYIPKQAKILKIIFIAISKYGFPIDRPKLSTLAQAKNYCLLVQILVHN